VIILYVIVGVICGVLLYAFLWVLTGTLISLFSKHAFEIEPEEKNESRRRSSNKVHPNSDGIAEEKRLEA